MIFIWEKRQHLWTNYRTAIIAAILAIFAALVVWSTCRYGKTIWDLMELLIVPLTLAIIAGLFHLAEREKDRKMTEAERNRDRELAADHNRGLTLSMYLDRMVEMLCETDLSQSEAGSDVQTSAWTITHTVLPSLDQHQKGRVLQFLYNSHLINTDGTVINLENANLIGAHLARANLANANLRGADLRRADLTGANLEEADLTNAVLFEAIMVGAKLHRATLVGARMAEADLRRAWLIEAKLGSDNLATPTQLHRAILRQAQLYSADLRRVELTRADLTGANLGKANLQWADLTDANLSGAWLRDADLANTILKGITRTKDTKWPTDFPLPVFPADRAET